MRVGFEQVSALYHVLSAFDLERGAEAYSETGLSLPLQLFPEDVSAFAAALRDATRGQAELDSGNP